MATRRSFLAASLAAAPRSGELFEATVCPGTAAHPRNDHAQILPLSGGRLLLAWCQYYATRPSQVVRHAYETGASGDLDPCRIAGRLSLDRGRTWSAAFTLQESVDGGNVKHPNFLRLPSGEILFCFSAWDAAGGNRAIYLRRSADECESFTPPVRISPPGGVYNINASHILQHSSGRILLPAYWSPVAKKGDHFQAFCFYSDDLGRSWRQSRNRIDLPKRGAEEPAIAELPGGGLAAMLRSSLGKAYQSFSPDRGESWREATPTPLAAPAAATALIRVPNSGDLLFLFNHNYEPDYHHQGRRNPLSSAVSLDGGESWAHIRNIENREGYDSAYPSVTFVGQEALITYYHRSQATSRDTHLKLKIFAVDWFYG